MNLRLPIVATVVGVAVAAAAFRATHHGPAPFAGGTTTAAAGVDAASSPESAVPRPSPVPERLARVTVYVTGDVARPGVYALPATARAVDAVRAAGGVTAGADPVAVNLAGRLLDGEEIVVPLKGASIATAAAEDASQVPDAESPPRRRPAKKRRHKHRKHRSHRSAASPSVDPASSDQANDASADPPPPSASVDLNAAGENELEALPGIGAALAARIVAFREINGPFVSTDDLLDVGGMTQGRLDAIAPYLTLR